MPGTFLPRYGYAALKMKQDPAPSNSSTSSSHCPRAVAPLSALWGCEGELWARNDPATRLLDWSYAGANVWMCECAYLGRGAYRLWHCSDHNTRSCAGAHAHVGTAMPHEGGGVPLGLAASLI